MVKDELKRATAKCVLAMIYARGTMEKNVFTFTDEASIHCLLE